ncbi:WXG100 family type VII secretion target [Actinosynnema sp. CA-299493]
MTDYTFDQRIADQARDQMAETTRRLTKELEDMHLQVVQTLQEWSGDAKQQYQVAKSQWDQAAARMPASLFTAESALEQITQGYVRVEHAGVNAFGGYSVK